MKHVPLTQGKYALVDDQDYALVVTLSWYYFKTKNKEYAMAKSDGQTIYMHRYIMQPPDYLQVDHINGSGLDNRRTNLRLATTSQNNRNRRPMPGYTSPYKGVHWLASRNRWRARLGHKHLGYFEDEQEAARAYDTAARAQWGEFALTNFPAELGQERAA